MSSKVSCGSSKSAECWTLRSAVFYKNHKCQWKGGATNTAHTPVGPESWSSKKASIGSLGISKVSHSSFVRYLSSNASFVIISFTSPNFSARNKVRTQGRGMKFGRTPKQELQKHLGVAVWERSVPPHNSPEQVLLWFARGIHSGSTSQEHLMA